MSSEIVHINQLLQKVFDETLFEALVVQINKDLLLANVDYSFSEKITPENLKNQLYTLVESLINNQFDDFLSFLYRIDLSEAIIRSLPKQNFQAYIAEVSFLILKREWQKVWFRKNYS